MLDWDNSFRGLVRKNQLTLHLYRRFVDDNFNGMEALPAGLRWMEEDQSMMLNLDLVEEDKSIPEHEGTMREIVKMANSINNMIQLTGACPSKHESGEMPLLDTQVWVEDSQPFCRGQY